jgi:hypothetical protein
MLLLYRHKLSASRCDLSRQSEHALPLETLPQRDPLRAQVWEALDVSEVLFLCEKHRIDVVIIGGPIARLSNTSANLRERP